MHSKKDISIVFMGTPRFAVESLDILIKNGYNIKAVLTATDKKAGRGRKIKMPEVKLYALKQNLKILQTENLKDKSIIDELKKLNADLFVVVAFRKLPKEIWQIPPLGTINLHASLLPDYRGAAPINWVIINGEKETGVTSFFINEKIDTGDIILQKKIKINEKDNAGTLHDKLMKEGALLLLQTVKNIESGCYSSIPQDKIKRNKIIHTAPKINKEICKINWQKDTKDIYNFIRGLSPYPGAWTIMNINGKKVFTKIFECDYEYCKITQPGKILTDNKNYLKIFTLNGCIILNCLQLSGKKRMKIKEFLAGNKIPISTYFS